MLYINFIQLLSVAFLLSKKTKGINMKKDDKRNHQINLATLLTNEFNDIFFVIQFLKSPKLESVMEILREIH